MRAAQSLKLAHPESTYLVLFDERPLSVAGEPISLKHTLVPPLAPNGANAKTSVPGASGPLPLVAPQTASLVNGHSGAGKVISTKDISSSPAGVNSSTEESHAALNTDISEKKLSVPAISKSPKSSGHKSIARKASKTKTRKSSTNATLSKATNSQENKQKLTANTSSAENGGCGAKPDTLATKLVPPSVASNSRGEQTQSIANDVNGVASKTSAADLPAATSGSTDRAPQARQTRPAAAAQVFRLFRSQVGANPRATLEAVEKTVNLVLKETVALTDRGCGRERVERVHDTLADAPLYVHATVLEIGSNRTRASTSWSGNGSGTGTGEQQHGVPMWLTNAPKFSKLVADVYGYEVLILLDY